MRYSKTFMNMVEIGQLFGVSSHQVGKWLKELGLREHKGSPSKDAYSRRLLSCNFNAHGTYNTLWHAQRTVQLMEAAGHERIHNPPCDLVEAPLLAGPFTLKQSEGDCWHVVGDNGDIAAAVTGCVNAQAIRRLLNIAEDCGHLARLVARSEKDMDAERRQG